MANPWEEYQTEDDGPWAEFATPEKKKATLGQDIDIGLEEAGYGLKTAGKFFLGGVASLLGNKATADEVYKDMDADIATRKAARRASPQQGLGGKVISGVIGGVPQMFTSPVTSAAENVNAGATTTDALKALSLDTILSMAQNAVPAGKGLAKGAGIGVGVSVADATAGNAARQKLLEQSAAKDLYDVTGEGALIAGITGGAAGGIMGKMQAKAAQGKGKVSKQYLEQAEAKAKAKAAQTADSVYAAELAKLDEIMQASQAPQFGKRPEGKVERVIDQEGARQKTIADQAAFDQEMAQLSKQYEQQAMDQVTKSIDEQPVVSPFAQLDTPPELQRMNDKVVDAPWTMYADEAGNVSPELMNKVDSGANITSPEQLQALYAQQDIPLGQTPRAKGQRGSMDIGQILQGLEEMAQRIRGTADDPNIKNNASGDSSASLEALGRLDQEKELGRDRIIVDRYGNTRPLFGVDAVDTFAQAGETILQKGIGKDNWTILDDRSGRSKEALVRMAQARGQSGAFTPFAKKDQPLTKQFKDFESFYKSMPDEYKDVAADVWQENGGTVSAKDIQAPLGQSPLGEYLGVFGKNKSDIYAENAPVLKQSPDIEASALRDNLMMEGASAKRWFNNPAATWAINLVNGAKKQAEIRAKNQLKEIETSVGGLKTFFGNTKELHSALNDLAAGAVPETSQGKKLQENWNKVTNELYDSVNTAYRERQLAQGTPEELVRNLPKIDNYFPHMWEGPWGFKVIDKETGKTISLVRQKTRGDANKALKHIQDKLGNAEFELSGIEYNSLYDRSKFQQDLGLVNDSFLEMLDVLGNNDPTVAAKAQQFQKAIAQTAWDNLSFKNRTKRRIGVEGFQGAQPWKTPAENAKDALSVMTNYINDANMFVEGNRVAKEIKELSTDMAETHPNLVSTIGKYNEKSFGGLDNKLKVIDEGLDQVGKAIGMSGSTFKNLAFNTKNFITGLALGFGRPAFMLSNLLQAPTSAIPEMVRMSAMDRNVSIGRASLEATIQSVLLPVNKVLAKKDKGLFISEDAKKTYQYMVDNHVIDQTVMDSADQVNPSLPKKTYDVLSKGSIRATEQLARTWAFTSLTKAVQDAGYKLDDALNIARDMTDLTMVDMDKHNRPRVYQHAGLIGEFAGNLQNYKHSFLGNLLYDIKKAPNKGKYQALAAKMGLIWATAGAAGIIGVKEADALWELIKEGFVGGKKMLRQKVKQEDILTRGPTQWLNEETPLFVNIGPLSASLGADVSQSFAAPMIAPDDPLKALYPLGAKLGDVVQGTGQVAQGIFKGDALKAGEGLSKIVPDAPFLKGTIEEQLMSTKDKDGNLLVENPRVGYGKVSKRTPEQQQYRMMGLRENNESLDKSLDYMLYKQEGKITEERQGVIKKVAEAMASATINKRFSPEFKSKIGDLAEQYVELGGDLSEFEAGALAIGIKRADTDIVTQEIKRLKSTKSLQKANRRLESFKKSRANR